MKRIPLEFVLVIALALVPLLDLLFPVSAADALRPILVFAILGLGLNIVTGLTGLLHLGVAGFMAIGAYVYAISTCDIYPFQIGFWPGVLAALVAGAATGCALGIPTLGLRGDYLAIVTMGFGEIIQDSLRNLDTITKGTQGINPLPPPVLGAHTFGPHDTLLWYYLYWGVLAIIVVLCHNLLHSRVGRGWLAVREDELAAGAMAIPVVKTKLLAFSIGAALCSVAGALWAAHLGSTGEPGNYDFQVSILALCIVIVGGMGSLAGVLLGAVVMVGFNSIFLVKLSDFLASHGLSSTASVYASPNNWKYGVFGLALILVSRFRPRGFLPARGVR